MGIPINHQGVHVGWILDGFFHTSTGFPHRGRVPCDTSGCSIVGFVAGYAYGDPELISQRQMI